MTLLPSSASETAWVPGGRPRALPQLPTKDVRWQNSKAAVDFHQREKCSSIHFQFSHTPLGQMEWPVPRTSLTGCFSRFEKRTIIKFCSPTRLLASAPRGPHSHKALPGEPHRSSGCVFQVPLSRSHPNSKPPCLCLTGAWHLKG